jgi:hypothetical protein
MQDHGVTAQTFRNLVDQIYPQTIPARGIGATLPLVVFDEMIFNITALGIRHS